MRHKRRTNMGTQTEKAPRITKEQQFIADNIPAVTGEINVPVEVEFKEQNKTIKRSGKVIQYATPEDMLAKEFRGSMEYLLATVNNMLYKKAEAVTRQYCYVAAAGPAKKIYSFAGKYVRDSRSLTNDGSPSVTAEEAFELAKRVYASLFSAEEIDAIPFDAREINIGKESDSEKEND